ncbi:MAG: hypothetical protein NVS3B15_03790 [Sediminibacterium sp.]
MENEMYQDELEQFLQDEVKQHRMYPSDHVWNNIRTELHGYHSWPALSFISLFIITALTVATLLNNHPGAHIVPAATAISPALAKKSSTVVPAETGKQGNYFASISPDEVTTATFTRLPHDSNDPALTADQAERAAAITVTVPLPANGTKTADQVNMKRFLVLPAAKTKIVSSLTTSMTPDLSAQTDYSGEPVNRQADPMPENKATVAAKGNPLFSAASPAEHATADDFFKDFNYVPQVQPRKRNARFGFQFYLTPSTSYRRLTDEKLKEIIQPATTATANTPLNSNYRTDVNTVARHKPAMGLEFGFALLYNMSSRLKFKTGLQLNIRQYHISTFQSPTSDATTISLVNNYRGVENVVLFSPYNNNVGYKQTQLDNKIYQVSVPVGIAWEMIQGKHFGINTEASVQPTFTVDNHVYLLSTDLKHYTDGNNFLRKWNINTSVGFNITYRSGGTSWQIGPQVRYQHLPTYSNLYPIKEYLLDYGLRVGFTRQLK